MCFWQRLKHCWYLLRRRGGRFSTPEASSDHGNDFADFLPYGKHPDSQLPGTFFFSWYIFETEDSQVFQADIQVTCILFGERFGEITRESFSHILSPCVSHCHSLYIRKSCSFFWCWNDQGKKTMISQGTQLLPTQTDPPSVSFFLQVNMGAYIFLSLCDQHIVAKKFREPLRSSWELPWSGFPLTPHGGHPGLVFQMAVHDPSLGYCLPLFLSIAAAYILLSCFPRDMLFFFYV